MSPGNTNDTTPHPLNHLPIRAPTLSSSSSSRLLTWTVLIVVVLSIVPSAVGQCHFRPFHRHDRIFGSCPTFADLSPRNSSLVSIASGPYPCGTCVQATSGNRSIVVVIVDRTIGAAGIDLHLAPLTTLIGSDDLQSIIDGVADCQVQVVDSDLCKSSIPFALANSTAADAAPVNQTTTPIDVSESATTDQEPSRIDRSSSLTGASQEELALLLRSGIAPPNPSMFQIDHQPSIGSVSNVAQHLTGSVVYGAAAASSSLASGDGHPSGPPPTSGYAWGYNSYAFEQQGMQQQQHQAPPYQQQFYQQQPQHQPYQQQANSYYAQQDQGGAQAQAWATMSAFPEQMIDPTPSLYGGNVASSTPAEQPPTTSSGGSGSTSDPFSTRIRKRTKIPLNG